MKRKLLPGSGVWLFVLLSCTMAAQETDLPDQVTSPGRVAGQQARTEETAWEKLGLPVPNPEGPYASPKGLEPLFRDELAADTRGEYEVDGSDATVHWTSGTLTLDSGATLARQIEAREWIELEFGFQFPELTEDGQESELNLLLDLEPAAGSCLVLRQERSKGRVRSRIALHGTAGEASGDAAATLVRDQLIDGPLPAGRWRIGFCGGVWTVASPDSATGFSAFIDTGVVEVKSFRLSCSGSAMAIRHVAASGRRPVPEALSPTAQRELQRAEELHDEVYSLMSAGKAAEALPLAKESLAIRLRRHGLHHSMVAIGINNLASALITLGRADEAEMLLKEALAIQQRLYPVAHPDVARCLNNLAHVAEALGRAGEAEPRFEQALAMYREVLPVDHPEIVANLNNLAHVRKSLGRAVEAEAMFVEALAMSQRLFPGDHPYVAGCLNNLALVRESLGLAAEAETLHEQALKMRQRLFAGDHPAVAGSLGGLASARWSLGQMTEAEPLYREAADMYRRLFPGDHPLVATSLDNLAAALGFLGRAEEAEPLHEEALQMRQRLFPDDHPDVTLSLTSLGRHYLDLGESVRAESLLTDAADKAARYLQRSALALSENQELALQSQHAHVLEWLVTAAVERGQAGLPVLSHTLGWKGAVFRRQQLSRLARSAATAGIQQQFDQLRTITARLTHSSLNPPRAEKLDAWRHELTSLESRRVQLERDLSGDSAEYRQFQNDAGFGPGELCALLPEGAVLVDLQTFQRRTGELNAHGVPIRRPAHCAVIFRASGDPVLVELAFADEIDRCIAAWRNELDGPSGDALQPGMELRRMLWEPLLPHLEGSRTVLISPAGSTALIPWGALPGSSPGHFLLEDFAIGVVPVPQALATLRAPAAEDPAASLLLVADVNYGASPGAGSGSSRNRDLPTGAVQRDGSRKEWAGLPAAGAEAASVEAAFAQRFPGARVQKLNGADATEQRVQAEAERHAFIHLVTHGYFASPAAGGSATRPSVLGNSPSVPVSVVESMRGLVVQDPLLFSGLVLAGANLVPGEGNEDGYLLAADVATLDLRHARLVTLSACETGLGELASGEGILGLQRAFQVAGAGTTVTSLWKVDDAATQVLMARFYANLWGEPGRSRLEALREAQLWMIRNPAELQRLGVADPHQRGGEDTLDNTPAETLSHPYYWAAWVLAGDWR